MNCRLCRALFPVPQTSRHPLIKSQLASDESPIAMPTMAKAADTQPSPQGDHRPARESLTNSSFSAHVPSLKPKPVPDHTSADPLSYVRGRSNDSNDSRCASSTKRAGPLIPILGENGARTSSKPPSKKRWGRPPGKSTKFANLEKREPSSTVGLELNCSERWPRQPRQLVFEPFSTRD